MAYIRIYKSYEVTCCKSDRFSEAILDPLNTGWGLRSLEGLGLDPGL